MRNYFRAMSKASWSSKDSTLLRNVNGLLYFQHGRTARPFLGRLFCRYLGIFYNAKLVSSVGNHTDRLGWACLGNDLGRTVGLFLDAVTEGNGSCDADEAVVDAVGVDIEDFALGEIGEDGSA